MNQLIGLLPNDQLSLQRLTEELHFGDVGVTKKYLPDSLQDTLEHLVRSNVFYQVAHWRCRYCGHMNSRSFDNMKIKNECNVCATNYSAPIDLEWQYELNGFVYRSLQKHSGLPVLWTLGFIQDRLRTGSLWYLPEVDLYEKQDDPQSKNEIDILCMLNGAFHAIETKLSASMFLNKPGALDKFARVIGRLQPDVAMLTFEQYCPETADIAATKIRLSEAAKVIRERIGPWIKLEILVAHDTAGFNDFPADIGWHGPRSSKYQ